MAELEFDKVSGAVFKPYPEFFTGVAETYQSNRATILKKLQNQGFALYQWANSIKPYLKASAPPPDTKFSTWKIHFEGHWDVAEAVLSIYTNAEKPYLVDRLDGNLWDYTMKVTDADYQSQLFIIDIHTSTDKNLFAQCMQDAFLKQRDIILNALAYLPSYTTTLRPNYYPNVVVTFTRVTDHKDPDFPQYAVWAHVWRSLKNLNAKQRVVVERGPL
ncbi:hypothetical protein EVB27_036 [Rhizobium phage RHph_TM16]|nr:hypothetical protein EVB27_036 [Rhizobium phage RHph_TM16]